MKALKVAGIVIVVLVLVFVGGAFLLPRVVTVERTIEIDAPPAAVFPYLNSFQKFNEWSPWAGIDPDTKYEFTGPDAGVGHRMEWTSEHPDVGSGSQEIVTSEAPTLVESELDFGEAGTGEAYFRLEPIDGGTGLTWGLNADMGNNPVGRWMGLAMDGWIGSDYEKGLASLKETVEGN